MTKLEKMQKILRKMEWIVGGCLLALILSCLVSCGSASGDSAEADDYTDADVTTEANLDDSEDTTAASSGDETFMEAFHTDATITETVLWDERDVRVTATALSYSSWSADLELTIENNSNEDFCFSAGTVSYCWNAVNGYMVADGYLMEDLEAGESVETELSFDYYTLQQYGINEIADITFGLCVEDDDYNEFYLTPKKLETSAAGSYDYETDTYMEGVGNGLYLQMADYTTEYLAEDTMYDNNGIAMISEVLMSQTKEDETSYAAFLEMRNQSEYNIYVTFSDLSINGVSLYESTYASLEMLPGTRGVKAINLANLLSRYEGEEDITQDGITSFTFTLSIKNENYENALTPQEITINFK